MFILISIVHFLVLYITIFIFTDLHSTIFIYYIIVYKHGAIQICKHLHCVPFPGMIHLH